MGAWGGRPEEAVKGGVGKEAKAAVAVVVWGRACMAASKVAKVGKARRAGVATRAVVTEAAAAPAEHLEEAARSRLVVLVVVAAPAAVGVMVARGAKVARVVVTGPGMES
jgi:hypothetical protein